MSDPGGASSRGLRLLVADDDDAFRRALVRLLKSHAPGPCDISEAADGTRARSLLLSAADGAFDCAFLDHQMPGEDGLSILRAARQARPATPIVMLTGEGSEELAVDAMKAGAADYVVKGRLTPELLDRTLRHALRLRDAEARAAAARHRQWESEERFRRLVETAEDGVWILDAEGTTDFVNAGAAAMIGYAPEEMVGRPPTDFIADEPSRAATVEGLGRRRMGFRERRECVLRHRDGTPVWVVVAASPLTGPAGEYRGSFAVLTDISRQKRAERALRESEERFRRVFEDGPVGMTMTGLDRRIMAANAAFGRLIGRDSASLAGTSFEDITHPDDVGANEELIERVRRGDASGFQMEKRYVRPDGAVVWGSLTSSLIRDSAGAPSYMLSIIEDVTQRRAATEALRASEARFRSLFESSPVAIGIAIRGVTRYANPAYLRLFGYDRESDLIGRSLLEHIAPSARAEIADRLARRERGEPLPGEYETVGLRRDGTEFPYHVRVGRMELPEGTANLAFVTDLTERRRQERELTETTRTLRAVIAASPLAIGVVDGGGVVRLWNPAAERLFGWAEAEVVGRPLPLDPAAAGDPPDLHRRLLAGDVLQGIECNQPRKDGSSVRVSASAAPIRETDGTVTGFVVVCADVTESTRLREQLAQAQKMESLGRLAGGIAHDFNNLLAVIGGYAESLERRIPEGEPGRAQVDEIGRAAERGARLVKQLLAFSRSRPLSTERVDLVASIAGVCQMLGQVIGSRIVVRQRDDGRPAWIDADPAQVEQLLVNLALNARDAMPDGGAMTFEASHAHAPDDAADPPGDWVRLSVSDTGRGMDEATRSRIFEPFFTTRPDGTGLGLSIVYGIVQQQRGHITVHSEPGKGTRFDILLPAAAAAPGSDPPQSSGS